MYALYLYLISVDTELPITVVNVLIDDCLKRLKRKYRLISEDGCQDDLNDFYVQYNRLVSSFERMEKMLSLFGPYACETPVISNQLKQILVSD